MGGPAVGDCTAIILTTTYSKEIASRLANYRHGRHEHDVVLITYLL